DDGAAFKVCNWKRLVNALNELGMTVKKQASVKKNLTDYGFRRLTDSRRRIPEAD
ncbi:hypothetical protein IWW55_005480, partial [Coemansia sp. RSA 2706]